MILTKDEAKAIGSMSRYWDEVEKREDSTPLGRELDLIVSRLGIRILWIVADYAKKVETQTEDEKVLDLFKWYLIESIEPYSVWAFMDKDNCLIYQINKTGKQPTTLSGYGRLDILKKMKGLQ